jgi:hypothetical protein
MIHHIYKKNFAIKYETKFHHDIFFCKQGTIKTDQIPTSEKAAEIVAK